MKRTVGALLAIVFAAALIYALRTQGSWIGGGERAPRPSVAPGDSSPAPKAEPPALSGLRGTVAEGGSSRPVEGARVQLLREAKPGDTRERGIGRVPARGHLWNEATTNLAGRFQMPLPPEPGAYYLRVEKEGFAPAETPVFAIPEGAGSHEPRIGLHPAAALELRPTYRGEPLRGFQAVLLGKAQDPRVAPVDAGGTALFQGLAAGPYWVRFDPLGADTNRFFWEALEGPPKGPPALTLTEGESRVFDLPIEGEDPGKAAGSVTINDLPPAGACRLSWTFRNHAEGLPVQPLSVTPDSNGRFQLERIRPGEYFVQLFRPPAPSPLWQKTVSIPPGQWTTVDIALRAGSCLGKAFSAGGVALRQARVVFKGQATGVEPVHLAYWTDAEGRFRTGEVPAGDYEIAIYPGSGDPLVRRIRIDRGEVDLGEIRP